MGLANHPKAAGPKMRSKCGAHIMSSEGFLVCLNKVKRLVENIKKTPAFFSCPAGGPGVASTHIHLESDNPQIPQNQSSSLILLHAAKLSRMKPAPGQDMDRNQTRPVDRH